MFSRILNIKKEKVVTPCEDLRKSVKIEKEFQAIPSKLPILDKDKIRVLIYKDAEPRGDRTLLFDSDALQSAAINEHSESKKEKSKEQEELKQNTELKTKFKLKKPSSDVKMLGEMIFGSVAMIYKGAIVKIHIIRSPPQLLMTKVFALRSRNHEVNLCDSNMSLDSIHMWQSDSADSSSSESIMRTLSKSSAVSHPIPTPVQPSFLSKSKSVNGYSLSDCYKSSSLVSEKSMSSPNGCLQTRFHRFQKTSLDLPNLWRSKSESSDEGTYKQQPKIGIGIIFKQWNTAEENKAFQAFFFSHFALIEWHLQALRIKIEKSFYLHNNFMKASIVGVECFKEDILNLFYTPRILEPTWLSLMTSDDTHNIENVNSFMESFMSIASVCEKKETNYFLSILLTAVLSHHTSWVATVMSSGLTSKRAFMDKHSSKAVAVLAKCHPYNPLWAQLCDMYGSISVPLKLARTVIVGQNKTFVCQLLQVLTYFIRCSDVKETIMQMVPEEEKQVPSLGTSFEESTLNFSSNTPKNIKSWVENSQTPPEVFCNDKEFFSDNISNKSKKSEILLNGLGERHCDCSQLQKMKSVLHPPLKCCSHLDSHKCFSDNLNSLTVINQKSCYICGTLEKLMYDMFCEHCKKDKNFIGDLLCQTCFKCLENLYKNSQDLLTQTKSNKSFVCYCCPSINQTESNISDKFYRPRKSSDPIPCISPKSKSTLRNSTKSHDSGTEDMNFIPYLNERSISCNSSISSHSSSIAVADMDSDYCSIDNDTKRFSLKEQSGFNSNNIQVSESSGTLKNIELNFQTEIMLKEKQSTLSKDLKKMSLKELSMPRTHQTIEKKRDSLDTSYMTFGRSLLAGYSENYTSNFVLQGVAKLNKEKLAMDLKNSVQYSVLDEVASDAICIVANVDNWTCETWSLTRRTNSSNLSISESLNTKSVFASDLVSSLVESTKGLWELKFSPNSCLLHVEEQLKDIYNRGKVLVEFAKLNPENVLSAYVQSSGYHSNDVDLLTAVGSTYTFNDGNVF
ncbi:folliculin-interacting protein 1 isoform X4 [Hydra vulgaris]|uniref:Folliculin-interacting protein 1 isoform X4 n=1 Tax=Hydra vulgaris TaxID=6087 RepID=A0ABM4BQZ2_HYDVU